MKTEPDYPCANCGCPPHPGRTCGKPVPMALGATSVDVECACSSYEPLEPPDSKQCQCEITPAHGPFVLGPRPKPRRCTNPTAFIATEAPRADGKARGSMGVCETCVAELRKQMPDATIERVKGGTVYITDQRMMLCRGHAEEVGQTTGAEAPFYGCQMCRTHPVEGNVCYRDACRKPLHKQWPAVYCSNECALLDA